MFHVQEGRARHGSGTKTYVASRWTYFRISTIEIGVGARTLYFIFFIPIWHEHMIIRSHRLMRYYIWTSLKSSSKGGHTRARKIYILASRGSCYGKIFLLSPVDQSSGQTSAKNVIDWQGKRFSFSDSFKICTSDSTTYSTEYHGPFKSPEPEHYCHFVNTDSLGGSLIFDVGATFLKLAVIFCLVHGVAILGAS